MLGRFLDKIMFYVLLLMLFGFSYSLFQNYQKVKRVDDQIQKKEEEVENIRLEGVELQKRLEIAQSDQFIESQLRDKLGMSKEGEIIIILPSDEVLRSIAPKYKEKEEILPDPNWKKWVKLFM